MSQVVSGLLLGRHLLSFLLLFHTWYLSHLLGGLHTIGSPFSRWGNRVRELEKKYKEEEKTTIHSMVAAAELTPEQLSQIIRMAKAGELYYGALAEKCEEEIQYEE